MGKQQELKRRAVKQIFDNIAKAKAIKKERERELLGLLEKVVGLLGEIRDILKSSENSESGQKKGIDHV